MHVCLLIFMNSWAVFFLDRRGTGWICVLLRCKHLWSTLCVGTAWHMCPFPPHTEMMNRWVSVWRAAVRELAHTSSHTAEAFAGSARTKRDYPQLKRRIALEKKKLIQLRLQLVLGQKIVRETNHWSFQEQRGEACSLWIFSSWRWIVCQ